MRYGHADLEVSYIVLETLKVYNITHRLGFITSDNHKANGTLMYQLSTALKQLNIA